MLGKLEADFKYGNPLTHLTFAKTLVFLQDFQGKKRGELEGKFPPQKIDRGCEAISGTKFLRGLFFVRNFLGKKM